MEEQMREGVWRASGARKLEKEPSPQQKQGSRVAEEEEEFAYAIWLILLQVRMYVLYSSIFFLHTYIH